MKTTALIQNLPHTIGFLLFTFVLTTLLTSPVGAQTGWVASPAHVAVAPGLETDGFAVTDLTATPNGALYITGYFQGRLTFDDLDLTVSTGEIDSGGELSGNQRSNFLRGHLPEIWYTDSFLMKYVPGSGVAWVKHFDEAGGDVWGAAVTVDANKNLYWIGSPSTAGSVLVGDTAIEAKGGRPILAKFDPAGEVVWARQLDLPWGVAYRPPMSVYPGPTATEDLGVDATGNVYVTGGGWRPAKRSENFVPHGFHLAKFSSEGDLLWKRLGPDAWGRGLAVDDEGSVYVTGGFNGSMSLGSERVTNVKGDSRSGIFVARYDPDGVGQGVWQVAQVKEPASQLGYDIQTDMGYDIAADGAGNVYVTGAFGGTVKFGDVQAESRGTSDVFTAKYSRGGAVKWVKTGGSPQDDSGIRLGVGGGNVYVLATAFAELVLIKYSAEGKTVWFEQSGLGTDAPLTEFGFMVGAGGRVYLAGTTSLSGHFGALEVSPGKGDAHLFVVDLSGGSN